MASTDRSRNHPRSISSYTRSSSDLKSILGGNIKRAFSAGLVLGALALAIPVKFLFEGNSQHVIEGILTALAVGVALAIVFALIGAAATIVVFTRISSPAGDRADLLGSIIGGVVGALLGVGLGVAISYFGATLSGNGGLDTMELGNILILGFLGVVGGYIGMKAGRTTGDEIIGM